ncbi:MAG: CoA-binding protein [Patescibacteria group bacterium]|jgi:hypothetical protein
MEMIDKNYTYAIVGASANIEKYGHKVLIDLHTAGYKVIPINPKGGEIEGLQVYPSLSAVKEKIDVAIFVVPPTVTSEVLIEVKNLGIDKVWMQPGSESAEAIEFCKNNNINCVHDACIMVARQN